MLHPIEQRIEQLRSRIRRLAAIFGACWLLTAALGMCVVFGSLDYVFRFEDRGLRIMATLALSGVAGWTAYRWLYVTMRTPLGVMELAKYVQRCFPSLGDGLASAVEFLHQRDDDPTAGSPSLRNAVIARLTADIERVDVRRTVTSRPVWRAAINAVGVTIVALILAVLDPVAAKTAAARLANPFLDVPWPQTTHLAIEKASNRVARGQSFEIEVVDAQGVRLPNDVRIHYRFDKTDQSDATEEVEPMRFVGVSVATRRDRVARPFSYRVEGGDDHSMPWTPVEVVDPPSIESAAIRLYPPTYTGWAVEPADRSFRALVGTRVEWKGKASTPIAWAVVCLEGGREIPAKVGEDRQTFSILADSNPAFVVEKSGAYGIRLTDVDGLVGGEDQRWEIRAIGDAPPSVTMPQPNANVFVTPLASLPIEIRAHDDLAIARVALEYARSGPPEETPTSVALYVGKLPAKLQPGAVPGTGDDRDIRHTWELEPLALRPGMQVTFRAAAADFQPRVARSDPRQLTVVTTGEMTERIAARQAAILEELARVLQLQRQCRGQVAAVEGRAKAQGSLNQQELDQLRAAELNQRQITQTLTGRAEGIPSYLAGVLADLVNNKLDNPETHRRVTELASEIERLGREELPEVARRFTASIKSAQVVLDEHAANALGESPRKSPEIGESIAAAGRSQDRAIASLDRMLGELGRWDSYRRFDRELRQILREEEDLAQRTSQIARATLTKELHDLTPQEQSLLQSVSRLQADLSQRADRIEQGMAQAASQAGRMEPAAMKTLADAVTKSRELMLGVQMRAAVAQIDQNRIGQAIDAEQKIVEGLHALVDILAGGNARDSLPSTRVRDAVRAIALRQEKTLDETRRLAESKKTQHELAADRTARASDLSREQSSLQAETAAWTERLANAEAVSLALGIASHDMAIAAGLLDQRDLGASTLEAQQNALTRLRQIVEALKPEPAGQASGKAGKTPQKKGSSAGEGEVPNVAQLKLLKILQEDVNRRTKDAEQIVRQNGPAAVAARRTLSELAGQQGRLGDLVVEMVRKLENGGHETEEGEDIVPGSFLPDVKLPETPKNLPASPGGKP
jgi:hypothetical protein